MYKIHEAITRASNHSSDCIIDIHVHHPGTLYFLSPRSQSIGKSNWGLKILFGESIALSSNDRIFLLDGIQNKGMNSAQKQVSFKCRIQDFPSSWTVILILCQFSEKNHQIGQALVRWGVWAHSCCVTRPLTRRDPPFTDFFHLQ